MRKGQITGKTVQDTPAGKRCIFLQNFKRFLMRIPVMDNDRQFQFLCQAELLMKKLYLILFFAIEFGIIQSYFTKSNHLGMPGQADKSVKIFLRGPVRIMWMNADGCVDRLVLFCQSDGLFRTLPVYAYGDNMGYAGLHGPVKNLVKIILVRVHIKVTMGIHQWFFFRGHDEFTLLLEKTQEPKSCSCQFCRRCEASMAQT